MSGVAVPVDHRQSEGARLIARGMRRHLAALGFASVTELPLRSGRRADIVAIGAGAEIWIIEIKSSPADLRADKKWPDYRAHCDRLYFALAPNGPLDAVPLDAGLFIADAFSASMVREAPIHRLSGATRTETLLRFARQSALRLHALCDPGVMYQDGD